MSERNEQAAEAVEGREIFDVVARAVEEIRLRLGEMEGQRGILAKGGTDELAALKSMASSAFSIYYAANLFSKRARRAYLGGLKEIGKEGRPEFLARAFDLVSEHLGVDVVGAEAHFDSDFIEFRVKKADVEGIQMSESEGVTCSEQGEDMLSIRVDMELVLRTEK